MLSNQEIAEKALEIGFTACGFAPVQELSEEKEKLRAWVKKGLHGNKKYLEAVDIRSNPEHLLSNAKTVISLATNYYPGNNLKIKNLKIAKFANGIDYHYVLKEKLNILAKFIKENTNSENIKICVDSSPIMERAWAVKSGIGWIGKNNCLIIKGKGSFFFLSEIITDITFDYNTPYNQNHCGECRKCIDACPTNALFEPYQIDIAKCISYISTENNNKDNKQTENIKNNNFLIGCDICQDVCPFNKDAQITNIKEFGDAYFDPLKFDINQVMQSKSQFNKFFKNSPIKRVGYDKFIKLICEKNNPVLNKYS